MASGFCPRYKGGDHVMSDFEVLSIVIMILMLVISAIGVTRK